MILLRIVDLSAPIIVLPVGKVNNTTGKRTHTETTAKHNIFSRFDRCWSWCGRNDGRRYRSPVRQSGVAALEAEIKRLDIELLCGQKVEQIDQQNGAVIGVTTGKQSYRAANVIIASGGPGYVTPDQLHALPRFLHSTNNNLIEPDHIDKKLRKNLQGAFLHLPRDRIIAAMTPSTQASGDSLYCDYLAATDNLFLATPKQ